ncbi:MAG: response regulator transcription factor [Betaproteobacteria bacterium]|nr:response regulator transcription factor [Betaproteobacteria bacterium]
MKSRVVLADDHRPFREAMRMILERDPGIEVVGEAGDGTEALDLVQSVHPDVLVIDVRMPGVNGIAALRQLVAADSCVKVIVLSVASEPIFASAMLGAGARGYVTKGDAAELPRAVRAVVSDNNYLSTEVAAAVAEISGAGGSIIGASYADLERKT